MNEEIKVNDGGGLFNSDGLIDTLIVDCNNLTKSLISGQYVQYCNTIISMVQKLSQLRDGIRNDMETKDKTIAELKSAENGPAILEGEL